MRIGVLYARLSININNLEHVAKILAEDYKIAQDMLERYKCWM
jgi:hypothetical protein